MRGHDVAWDFLLATLVVAVVIVTGFLLAAAAAGVTLAIVQ